MSVHPSGPQGARAEVAAYIRAQSVPLHGAAEAQKKWAPAIQHLFQQFNQGKHQTAALNARAIGRQYAEVYRKCLGQAEALRAPQAALRCQEYTLRWLRSLVNACQVMSHAAEDGKDTSWARDALDYLDDARYAVKPMTEVRQRLYEVVSGRASSSNGKG